MKLPVNKCDFLNAMDENPQNGWVKFIYKYFSKETKTKDLWLKRIFVYTLIATFGVGFIFTILHNSEIITEKLYRMVVGNFTLTYAAILAVLVLGGFVAIFMKNAKIKKIRKILGISIEEYNQCVNAYL